MSRDRLLNKSYSELLRDPRWQKKRLEVMARDKFTCQRCGAADKTLCVHHLWYEGDPWDVSLNGLLTLCEDCHSVYKDHASTEGFRAGALIRLDNALRELGLLPESILGLAMTLERMAEEPKNPKLTNQIIVDIFDYVMPGILKEAYKIYRNDQKILHNYGFKGSTFRDVVSNGR